ncbi:MAG: hypothetical protein HFJ06_10655 [Lachnospiraceae bacterium]|nr:hypothetical protein [Lachnospiraceae bacterium]
MNNIIKQIEVDVYSPTFYEVIKAQQGDKNSRFVEFILFNQGDPYTIPDNVIVKLEGSRPNKSPVIKPDTIENNIITIKNNVITVELDEDLLYYAGISHLKIVLYDTSDHSVLSTIPFTLSVQKNPLNSDKFEKDNYSLLNQLILQTETVNQNLEKHISDNDDPHTIIYEEPDTISKLTVGEKLSDTFGKLSRAVSDLISHINNNIHHITSEERENWNDSYNKRHVHSNISVLDKVTQTLLDNWNAAYSHISNNIKHITSTERTLWNTISNKLDKSGDIMTGTLYNATPHDDNRSTSMSSDGFFNHVPRGGYAGGMNWVDQDGKKIGAIGLYKNHLNTNKYYYMGDGYDKANGVLKLDKVIGDLEGTSKDSETLHGYPADRFTKQYNDTPQANEMNPNEICTLGYVVNSMLQNETDNPIKEKGWYHIWSQAWNKSPDNWVSQIAIDVQNDAGNMYFRHSPGEGEISGRSWRTLLDNTNWYRFTYNIIREYGVKGTNGYVNFARIKVLGQYINAGIEITIGRRGSTRSATLSILFESTSSTDPALANFFIDGNSGGYPVYIKKTSASTWDLYAEKNEPHGWITVLDLKQAAESISVTFPNAQASSVEASWIKATPYSYLKNTTLGGIAPTSWIEAGSITTNAEYFMKVYRSEASSKDWCTPSFSSAFVFGGHDCRGAVSTRYDVAEVGFAGGNTKSHWYMSIKGTSGKSYNLDTLTSAVSDKRDKTDFEKIDSEKALAFIENINPVSFVYNLRDNYAKDMNDYTDDEWNNYNKYGFKPYDEKSHSDGNKKGKRRHVGVNAQEILESINNIYGSSDVNNIVNDNLYEFKEIPESIENQYFINYEAFIPYLISAIQELSNIVKEQANRIEQLENHLK